MTKPQQQTPAPTEDEVLRRMLNKPPQPHQQKTPHAAKKKERKP